MKSFTSKSTQLLLVFIISSLITTSIGDKGEDGHGHSVHLTNQRPNALERAIGIRDPFSPWDKLKSWINLAFVNFRPPPLEDENRHHDAGEVVKEAVAKSFETSKETAEKAAKVAGHAVHETAEKMKRSVSSGREEM